MLKVLLCAPYGGVPGGISRWTEHIKKYYDSLGNCGVELCIVPMGRSMFVNTNASIWFRLHSAWIDYRKIFYIYFKRIKQFVPEVVHLTSSGSLSLFKDIVLLWCAHRHGAKTIVHFHFGRIPELEKKHNWEWRMLYKVITMADKVIVIDQLSYKTLKVKIGNKVDYLSNPLASQIKQVIEKQGTVVRESRKIVYAGHVVKTKGVYELIEACLDIPNIHLMIVGRALPGVKEELMEIVSRRELTDWITFCGEQPYDKVVYEMRTAAVFTLPSYTEGFPNVILESMACGCPIVATSVGAIPEMLADNTGIVIEPQNVLQLRQALLDVLDNPQKSIEMGERAATRVMNCYSMPVIWKQLTDFWNNVK